MPCACAATLRARWPKRSRSGVEPELGLRLLATGPSPDLLGSTAGGLGRPTDESQARPARRKPRATPNTIGGRLLFLACLRRDSRGAKQAIRSFPGFESPHRYLAVAAQRRR